MENLYKITNTIVHQVLHFIDSTITYTNIDFDIDLHCVKKLSRLKNSNLVPTTWNNLFTGKYQYVGDTHATLGCSTHSSVSAWEMYGLLQSFSGQNLHNYMWGHTLLPSYVLYLPLRKIYLYIYDKGKKNVIIPSQPIILLCPCKSPYQGIMLACSLFLGIWLSYNRKEKKVWQKSWNLILEQSFHTGQNLRESMFQNLINNFMTIFHQC